MRKGSRQPSKCQCCSHPERARLDYLLATGATCPSIAKKFACSKDAVWRHRARHISKEFSFAARIGPWRSEDELRKLVSENSTSVVENLKSIYGGLAARWLTAFEAGSDTVLVLLTKEMVRVLDMRARISKELAPPASTVINNVFNLPPVIEMQAVLLRVLARHPEARRDVIAAFAELEAKQPPLLELRADAEQAA